MRTHHDIAQSLYERRSQAVMVPYEDRAEALFQPLAKHCHDNVERWCALHPGHRIVRGWFAIDAEFLGYIFVAHSIIEDEAGHRFDITPRETFSDHPFLEFDGTELEFASLVAAGVTQLSYR